jgi:hypothetical protein
MIISCIRPESEREREEREKGEDGERQDVG